MSGRSRLRVFVAAVVGGLGLFGQGAAGQSRPAELSGAQYGIGYVVNAPDAMVGVGGYVVLPILGGIGLYLDYKFDKDPVTESEDFEKGLTSNEVENQVTNVEYLTLDSSWRSFNAALVRPLNPYLFVYGGLGIARRVRYRQYDDPSKTLGRVGVFWVESPGEEEERLNMLLGMIMRITGRFSFHLGLETDPRGITTGVSLRLPYW